MMTTKRELHFQLHIDNEEFAHYYRGNAKAVIVRTNNGQTLSLPASAFQPFVSHTGIDGKFIVEFDHNNKLLGLRRAD